MDLIEEEDFPMMEEAGPIMGRRGRGRGGPIDVTFSVFVHPTPAPGEVVCLTGTIAELTNPVQMQPNQTGDRRLWHATVQINAANVVPPPAQQAPAALIGLMAAGTVLGNSRGTTQAPTFEYGYTIQNNAGTTIRSEDGARGGEQGDLKQFYYHKAKFSGPDSIQDEGFKLFVNDEMFLLQSNVTTIREFHRRMVALAGSNFTKKRALLDKALEELIAHWGMDTPAPAQVVLAAAAALGTMKRQGAMSGVGLYGFESYGEDYPFGHMGAPSKPDKEKEKEEAPSLIVCRWIVKHCPSRADVEDDHRERERGRENRSMTTTAGVRLAAETLYKEEQTFDWLKLLNFLPEHSLPQPVNASQCSRDEARRLAESFLRSTDTVFLNFQQERARHEAHPPAEAKDRQKAEQDMQGNMELFLRGLCSFCPSVDCMMKLVAHLRKSWEPLLEVITPMIFSRFRSLNFGKEDKECLRKMIQEVRFMQSDDTAVALLQNQNHPSEAFREREIVDFIKLVTEDRGRVRAAGPQLQSAARRWLVRYYGRPIDRPMERKEDKMAVSEMSRLDYQVMKRDIREAMRNALTGWHLILDLPCFKEEEETVRNLLFELSQSYFFKDQDPLLVLDCILDLEAEVASMRVWQLELEIQRIAIKSVRDAQDASEADHDANLLALLFETPTKLRYIIIEAFASFRQAAVDLSRLLQNEPIWSRLLSKKWLSAPGINEANLYNTQQTGMRMLKESAAHLDKGTINLSALHTIIRHRTVYESLVAQVAAKPTAIPESDAKLRKFDTEYEHLRAYVKLFCSSASIEAADLQVLIDGISTNYTTLELNTAASKFNGMAVRPHMSWLFSLKGSEVFNGIWKQTARPEGESERRIQQDEVVNKIIPTARQTWEGLAKSVESGEAVLKDIRWVVDFAWNNVQLELKLLESTTSSERPWVAEAADLCRSMRLAAKLRSWAPSMLHLRDQSLSELFKETPKDECVEKLNDVVREYEHMWEMTLGEMTTRVNPYRETINTLSEAMQDYTITAAKHDKSLEWLLQHSSTEDFNRLISLCTPNTDDPIILAAIASLKQMRTFLAEALFTKPPYSGLKKFIEELSRLTVDEAEQKCLESVQSSFEPMLDLLTTHSRTPGVQACYDLKKISQTGTFHVTCALSESAQLTCKMPPDSEFDFEALAELRRQLLMTDVPYELDGAKNLPAMLDVLVNKLEVLEDFGRCTMELFRLGHFAYRINQEVLVVPPDDSLESMATKLQALQQQLEDWQQAVSDARSKHYFLNYYTVRELCFLTDLLPCVDQPKEWGQVWPLLQCVDLSADEKVTRDKIKKALKRDLTLLRSSSGEPDKEVKLLNDVGSVLGELFEGVLPQVRPLEGLMEVKQQLQGDLLIRSMQRKEQGIPIFVCSADEACKVTELVLSIYTRRERVPEAEELLLCSSHTTLEEIELLLRRFFHARKHHREDRLYCVGNVHLLPYVTQCGTVEALRRMEEQFGFEHASALVFASGAPNQMLMNALNRHNLAVSILQKEVLKDAVAMVGQKYHGRPMQAVCAQTNGVGKSHYIYKKISELQAEHENKPLLHHVEIRETTDISALVSNLLSDPTDPATPTAVHINLAHILPSHVDTLLFELLIVGMLRDTHHSKVYHRRAKKDFFFIEIPNTPGENTAKQLSFCLILPRIFLQMGRDQIDEEMPVLKEEAQGLKITFVKNELLELVGKTLAAMNKMAFDPKSRNFDVTWTGNKATPVPVQDTYDYLFEVCCSETSPPSFLVFMNFVKFLGHLIKSAEEWNMMNLQLLQNFDPGLKHFKHCFFRLLIETSRDFALRQVPKAMDIGPSVLLPQTTLSRGGSRNPDANMPPELLRGLSSSSGPPSLSRKVSGPGAPSLHRQRSRAQQELQAQNEADAKAEKEGVGRIEASMYVARFDQMPSWESTAHPVANFKKNDRGNIIGCNIMSLQPNWIGHYIDRNLQNSLNLNDLKLDRDWSKVTHQDAVQLVHQIEGGTLLTKKDFQQGPKDYVVTVDNLIKLMSIQQRLRYGLPVILMGETGCGKTALVKFLAETLEFQLFTLDIHGGITDAAIVDFLEQSIAKANSSSGVLLFLDEINAANCMALFKTIIIDRMYGNKVIPENVRIISCCNPYRKRRNKELEDVALVFSSATGDASGISDPMKELVYRVHPLPESLIDVVSDFGSLSEASEDIYVKAILRKELPQLGEAQPAAGAAGAAPPAQGQQNDAALPPDDYQVFMKAFCDLLCQSQSYVREVNEGERSVVSMRDIGRAARVFKWFLTSYSKLRGEKASAAVRDDKDGALKINVCPELREHLRNALVLTMGYCYHSRLTRNQRWGYRKRLCETWERIRTQDAGAMDWLRLDNANDLNTMLISTSFEFVSQMDLGEGIALNEALRENLFMLLVSVMNQIPILLIGKPGCSKSLAMGVLQNNLNGEVSSREFFKSMPAVDVFAYQCSPLSTPDAILNAFHSARQSNLGHKSTIVCVLLDEVGLAEESPHLPLKVLHKELEDLRGIACVGISNWALDAAKMSRCVTLYRPPPTVDDLSVTAEGMVQSANLKAYLRALSEAFHEIYKRQKRPDFWGMREFYSTVRVINAELKIRAAAGLEAVLEPKVLMKTVQRNFGGQPEEQLENCIEEFFERTGMDHQHVTKLTTPELIKQNLQEPDARHLMLLTKNNAALRLLFEGGLLDHSRAEVMFGSTFPNDLSDMFVAMNLQRIKSFMQQPISLVMVHCDSLYESLYDLLNQHYMEYAGQRYVRIAHGSKAKQCPIHKLFRVIVVTELSDAYFRLAAPLLNRFEKQIFLRKDLMTKTDEALLARVSKFWNMLNELMNAGKAFKEDGTEEERALDQPNSMLSTGSHRPIAGYHPELLSSLVFTLRKTHAGRPLEELVEIAKRVITWVLTPEAVCITAATLQPAEMQMKFGFDIVSEYFEKQRHSDLPSFAEMTVQNKDFWCDDYGSQTMVMTYSPIRGKVGVELQKVQGLVARQEVSLHELSSATDIEKAVHDFYSLTDAADHKNFLIIHADPVAASVRMIEHCRFVCEKARNSFLQKGTGTKGSMFVVLVVHLQRGYDGKFSFDFDSQWSAVFLDSVEPSADLSSMPSLGAMLNMPLIDVVEGLEFPKLLRSCFRSSLSRLMYPHSRRPGDLQQQIQLMLKYIEDAEFVGMVREWVLHILRHTPKNHKNPAEGSVGDDKHWFAAIASAAQELALAGTFRAALHGRVVVLVGSLLSALLAHLDRNSGLELLNTPNKREYWLKLSTASLLSPLSARLQNEAISALTESATAQHEVGTDAYTSARPFGSCFPASWFISRIIDGVRHIIEQNPPGEQLAALQSQYQMSKLAEIGICPDMDTDMLENYMADFTAMHLDWTQRIGRDAQLRIVKKTLTRLRQKPLTSILEVHQLFWRLEKELAFSVNLLNAVPAAVPEAERLIEEAELNSLYYDLLLLVHQTLAEELCELSQMPCAQHQDLYREWLMRKLVVAGLTKDKLLSGHQGVDPAKIAKLKSNTEPRIESLALVLQHVAYPLELSPEVVKKFAVDLPKDKIRYSGTLLAMLNFGQEVVKQNMHAKALTTLSSFIESWFLDVCLRDAEAMNDLEPTSLRLVCSVAAGLPTLRAQAVSGIAAGSLQDWSENKDSGIAQLAEGMYVPRSSCLNLALLRKLIVSSSGQAKADATKHIEELLKVVAEHEKHNDTLFATRYAILQEEDKEADHGKCSWQEPQNWPSLKLEDMFAPAVKATPAKMLQLVGKCRCILSMYGQILVQDPVDEDLHALAVPKVHDLLQTDKHELASVCRSMRLYLLKCMERARGLSFVRSLMAEQPLAETSWVQKWRDLHDIDFEKFIGAALVPKWNPFNGETQDLAEYREAMAAVLELMTTTSTAKLTKFAQDFGRMTEERRRRHVAGLLLAVCQEPGLCAALEEPNHRPPWRPLLSEWLATSKDLKVNDKERTLLRVFSGDDAPIQGLPEEAKKFLDTFVTYGGRKMDDLLRWRVLGHLAAVLISAPETSLLHSLRVIMLEPQSLTEGAPPFLPAMDEDIRSRVLKALVEKGENIWKFKSHWYKCTCGFTFFIGECGRPMEVAKCPGCSLQIGGRDHNKTEHTFEDDESDRSPWGYMLPKAEKDEKHVSFREVQSSSARAIRLILHGTMFLSVMSSASDAMPRVFDKIVNQESMCQLPQLSEAEFIAQHFSNDWKSMVEILSSNTEDLAVGLHNLLLKMSEEARDEPLKPMDQSGTAPSWAVLTLQKRNAWEETIESKYLKSLIKNLDDSLQELYKRWGGDQEDGKFVAELKEAADVKDFPAEKREAEMPQLWAYRSAVTLDALHNKIGMENNAKEDLPVLCTVLQNPLINILPALGTLVGVFEWQSLCINQFSGRITKAQASEMTVADVLEEVPRTPQERQIWKYAFKAFERAWKLAMPYCEYECLQISESARQYRVSESDPILTCIPDSKDDGLYALAVIDWLVAQHNQLVQIVAGTLGYPARKVSSRLLAQHDIIKFSKTDLMRYLSSRCATWGVGGKLNLDLKQVEQYLRRELSRPEVTIEMRGFQWLGDSFAAGNELKTVINQRDLLPATIERLKMEIPSPALANACLQKVQMSISFIVKSGSSLGTDKSGEMLLADYMRNVLAESPEAFMSAAARSDVHLWHVDALVKVLKQIVNKDPLDSIDPKYKEELPKELEQELLAAKPNLPDQLVTLMGTFGETRLTETVIGLDYEILPTLASIRDLLDINDEIFEEIEKHLPPTLLMRHWAAAYTLLRS